MINTIKLTQIGQVPNPSLPMSVSSSFAFCYHSSNVMGSWVRLMSNGFSPKKIKNIKMGLFCVIKTLLLGKNSKNREHPKNSKWFFSNWFLNKQENKKWQKVEQHNHKQNHSSENEKYKSCKNSFFRCRPITFSNLLLRLLIDKTQSN